MKFSDECGHSPAHVYLCTRPNTCVDNSKANNAIYRLLAILASMQRIITITFAFTRFVYEVATWLRDMNFKYAR